MKKSHVVVLGDRLILEAALSKDDGTVLKARRRRLTPWEYYYRRKTITGAQYCAAIELNKLYVASGYGHELKTKGYSDFVPDFNPFSARGDVDRKIDAGKELKKIELKLGKNAKPARIVCAMDMLLVDFTKSRYEQAVLLKSLKDALDTLCKYFKINV